MALCITDSFSLSLFILVMDVLSCLIFREEEYVCTDDSSYCYSLCHETMYLFQVSKIYHTHPSFE